MAIFPNSLITAKAIPIFTSGGKHLLTNFHPISILSFFFEIFEKTIFISYSFFDKNLFLPPTQYAFIPNHSTHHTITNNHLCLIQYQQY